MIHDVVYQTKVDLRLGRYQKTLADAEVDAVIVDPPYGARTHGGQRHGRKDERYTATKHGKRLSSRGLSYAHWTPKDVAEFVAFWHPRTRGWICALTSHDLVPTWESELQRHGRYVFAPVACIQHAMNVRLGGDGPSNWACYLMVARPKTRAMQKWGTLPGAYVGPSHDIGENALDRSKRAVAGAKPEWLMRAIVRDYTRRGDLVCDPCAGGGTTLRAALVEGRRAVGAEAARATHRAAVKLLGRGFTPTMF